MSQLVYVTGNASKFSAAKHFCTQKGIDIAQLVLDIDEIQSENGQKIALDKAKKAYELSGHPVIVSDHWWEITGLNGFPGAYMKSMNHWLTAKNFIDLTKPLSDKQVILREYLVYTNGDEARTFTHERYGVVLGEPRGKSNVAWEQVVMMDEDEGLSVAEVFEQNRMPTTKEAWQAWEDFTTWYASRLI